MPKMAENGRKLAENWPKNDFKKWPKMALKWTEKYDRKLTDNWPKND
jgi:hypothetical protein